MFGFLTAARADMGFPFGERTDLVREGAVGEADDEETTVDFGPRR